MISGTPMPEGQPPKKRRLNEAQMFNVEDVRANMTPAQRAAFDAYRNEDEKDRTQVISRTEVKPAVGKESDEDWREKTSVIQRPLTPEEQARRKQREEFSKARIFSPEEAQKIRDQIANLPKEQTTQRDDEHTVILETRRGAGAAHAGPREQTVLLQTQPAKKGFWQSIKDRFSKAA